MSITQVQTIKKNTQKIKLKLNLLTLCVIVEKVRIN